MATTGFGNQLVSLVNATTSDIGNNYKVVPAQSYSLATGPATEVRYENQINTIPIIGSDVSARSYSPFTISILPPLLYLQNPDLLFGAEIAVGGKESPPINLGLITRAATRNLPNFSQTVKRLRGAALDNSQTTNYAITPSTSASRKVVGGRVANRPIGGSGGNSSSPSDQNVSYAITDQYTARDIAEQLNRILNIPPLTLYINPASFAVNYNKVQQYQDRSRSQYIYQTWGEEQPKLSISGKIGAFLAGHSNNQQAASGVQFASKNDSASFQQLMNLLTFFKNNGYIQDTLGKSLAPLLIGIVSIEYDQNTYLGYFDSFNWGYTETAQNGGLDFSFEFTVTQQYDNAQSNKVSPLNSPTPSPSDPRYGAQVQNAGTQAAFLTPQPQTLPPSVASFQQAASQAGFVSQTVVPVSTKGFSLPTPAITRPTDNVPIQPFFDPRTV